ncbi:MAG: hypothetical protein H6502_02725 [Candidatus Woesearchaeota archaeon]|nr:MAG: hypothetical protein H6502_02725 [Candidatus Woesearchaeota archaeon]
MRKRLLHTKAEMGIGTMVVFLALLLVAAIGAGVLIKGTADFQEKALSTSDQAEGQIATNIKVLEVSATDGRNGTLEFYELLIKLSPGSNAIKLSQALLTVDTYDETMTLEYRGPNGINELNNDNGYISGYNIIKVQGLLNATQNITLNGVDLDNNGEDDHLVMENISNSILYAFTDDPLNVSNQRSLGQCSAAGPITGSLGADLGYVDSITQTGSPCTAEDAATFDVLTNTLTIYGVGYDVNSGYYTAEYMQRGVNPVDGNLQQGDVIKIHFQAPKQVTEDEEMRLGFVPRIGTKTLVTFILPEVITEERVYLYPTV